MYTFDTRHVLAIWCTQIVQQIVQPIFAKQFVHQFVPGVDRPFRT